MTRRLSVPALLLLAGFLALPACDKKKKASDSDSPPPGSGPRMSPDDMKHMMTNTPGMPGAPGGAAPAGQPGPLPLFPSTNAVTRQITQNNLKMIGLAFHNYHGEHGAFPVGVADKSGNLGLSWRVALLPYLEQGNLFKQFKLDEPWDSESNKKLIDKMPKFYAAPQQQPTSGYTFYRSFSGQGAIMPPVTQRAQAGQTILGTKIFAIPDGTSNTLLVAEAAEPVIWTKPDDLPFTPGKPPKLGGGVFGDGFNAVLCDGSPRFIPITVDPKTLSNMIQINDGQIVTLP
jgi:hypothetical protein